MEDGKQRRKLPSPTIPKKVVQAVLDELKVRKIEGRTAAPGNSPGTGTTGTAGAASAEGAAGEQAAGTGNRTGRSPRGPRGGRGASGANIFSFLAIISAILEGIHYAEADELGYYLDYKNELNITDWAEFVQNWDPKKPIEFRGIIFWLKDGKLVGMNCGGYELRQDASGELYIHYNARIEPEPDLQKKDEKGKPPVIVRSSASGR